MEIEVEPFKVRSLGDFSEFLQRADEYDRTGKLTVPVSAAKGRAGKTNGAAVDKAVETYRDLLGRAASPATTWSDIDAVMKPIAKLTVPQLLEVAAKVEVPVPQKPKSEIVDALKRRATELKASAERTQPMFGS